MKKILFYSMIATATIMMTGCDSDDERTPSGTGLHTEIPMSESTRAITDCENAFALNLYKNLTQDSEAAMNNMCISPYSVFVSLSMTANGDDGATRDNILRILGIQDTDNPSRLNEYNNALLHYLPVAGGDQTICRVSNAVWYDPKYTIIPGFASVLENFYEASVSDQSPKGPEGMDRINQWAYDNTEGMITQLLSQPKNWDLSIINAAYFKGKWDKGFDKDLSAKGHFSNIDGSNGNATYMNSMEEYGYARLARADMLELGYADMNFKMYAVLPDKGMTPADLLSDLSAEELSNAMSSIKKIPVQLKFPKFISEQNYPELFETIKKMGLNSTILNKAMSGNQFPIEIVDIIHGVKLIVDEEGTEGVGSTVTGIQETGSGSLPDKPKLLEFNKPFLYIVCETSTGCILFMGQQTRF